MKKSTLILTNLAVLLVVVFATSAFAQKKTYTVSKRKKKEFGAYVSGNFMGAPVQGAVAWMPGLEAGVNFQRYLNVGLAFYHSVNTFQPKVETRDDIYYSMQFGGGKVEYVLNPRSTFQISFPAFVGAGQLKLINKGNLEYDKRDYDNFVVFIPAVKGDVKITPRLSTGIELNYRHYDRIVWPVTGLNNRHFNRPGANLTVKYTVK
jgi:hypothetical protein